MRSLLFSAVCHEPIDLSLAVLKGRPGTPALASWTRFLGCFPALRRHGNHT
ncbi:hypothetical protein [Alcaligenes sp. Marseille-Q7550]